MNKGEVFATPSNQHRFVLGLTPTGDVAFATRGGNTLHDYNHCQIQTQETFLSECASLYVASTEEAQRILTKFSNYMISKNVT
ncbi:MAG: hypothetical protein ACRERR_05420 [Moraxellaceae bacterium]